MALWSLEIFGRTAEKALSHGKEAKEKFSLKDGEKTAYRNLIASIMLYWRQLLSSHAIWVHEFVDIFEDGADNFTLPICLFKTTRESKPQSILDA